MDEDSGHIFIIYYGDICVGPVSVLCLYFGQEGVQISAPDQSSDRIDHHDYPRSGIADQIRLSDYICDTAGAYAV